MEKCCRKLLFCDSEPLWKTVADRYIFCDKEPVLRIVAGIESIVIEIQCGDVLQEVIVL